MYERNTRLSESFYTPLQSLEVCLRNTIDNCMGLSFGADWLQNGRAPLAADATGAVHDVLWKIKTPTSARAEDLVAEMKFAFWVSLLGPRYDATLWRMALHHGFRKQGGKRRSDVHGRLNALRRFRNRIAHHEPIFQHDLLTKHAEILEAIGWMCNETRAWTAHHSRAIAVIEAT